MKYNSKNVPLKCMMTQSTCYKGTKKMSVKGVLWHSTGVNNPYLKRYVQPDDNASDKDTIIKIIGKNNYRNDWNHATRYAGLNCWIGKLADGTVSTVQTMPWDYRPWGCGSGKKGSCNDGWIQFEICEDGLNDREYFNSIYKEACEITAYLCQMFGIDPNGTVLVNGVNVPTILCHADSNKLGFGSNHSDVNHWFPKYGKSMDTARSDVSALIMSATPIKAAQPNSESEREKSIWDFLLCKIKNEYGVAGLMGNLFAESALNPQNLQNSYEKKLGYTDSAYTAAVDSGKYKNFARDSAGYGIAQWTYWSRKEGLLNFAKTNNKSIGDLSMQLNFLYKELSESYKVVLSDLINAKSVEDASNSVLIKFERPANQSIENQKRRASFGQKFYDKYSKCVNTGTGLENKTDSASTQSLFSIGTIVEFTGTQHYTSTNATTGKSTKPSRAKIIDVRQQGKHPYLCRAIDSNGKYISGVYGWVDATDVRTFLTYTVKRGDTLSKIAAKYGTTYKELASYNNISNPNSIAVGQIIKIPIK